MRNRQREQLLIRVITMLDGAALAHDRERIMNLLHSARRASRDGFTSVASPLCFEAVKALSKVSGRLQAAGAAAETLEPVGSAIDLMLPDFVRQKESVYTVLMAGPPALRRILLSVVLLCLVFVYTL